MKKIDEQKVLRGNRFDVHRMTLLGSDDRRYQRDVIRHPGAVVIVPVLDDDRVVLIRNTRPTVETTLLELPAGTREPDEDPIVCAKRELIEETGYRAETFELLHEFYSAPGISDERMWLYAATDLVHVGADREATEQIENQIATGDQIRQWLRSGEIRDGKTLVGLYAWLSR